MAKSGKRRLHFQASQTAQHTYAYFEFLEVVLVLEL